MNNNLCNGFKSNDFQELLLLADRNDGDKQLDYYLQNLSSAPDNILFCTEVILGSHSHCQCTSPQQLFFFYKVLEKFLRYEYLKIPDSFIHEKIREFLSNLFYHSCTRSAHAQYITNKAAQLFALTIAVDYCALSDHSVTFNIIADINQWFLLASSDTSEISSKEAVYDFYLHILHSLQKDVLISNHECSAVGSRIKDQLREGDIRTILINCGSILNYCRSQGNSETTSSHLCCKVLSSYASWVDINLITDATLMNNLLDLIVCQTESSITLGNNKVINYLRALSKKGMPADQKVTLCKYLWNQVLQRLSQIPLKNTLAGMSESEFFNNFIQYFSIHEDFWISFAKLCNSMVVQLLLAYKELWRESESKSSESLDLAEAIVNVSFHLFNLMDRDVQEELFECWKEYLSVLKSLAISNSHQDNALPTMPTASRKSKSSGGSSVISHASQVNVGLLIGIERWQRVQNMLSLVVKKLSFPLDYDFDQEGDDEEEFQQFRKELLTILSNVIQLDVGMVLDFILSHLNNLNENLAKASIFDIEVILLVFHHLGESVPRLTCGLLFNNESFVFAKKMCEIMQVLCSSQISHITHKEVKLLYFETIVRYEAFFTADRLLLLGGVLEAMLDDRGIRNEDRRVRLRSAYLFSRLIRTHRNEVKPFTADILRGISDLLILPKPDCLKQLDVASHNHNLPPIEECSQQAFIYETAAQLIFSSYSHSPTECAHYLSQLHNQVLNSVPDLVEVWILHRKDVSLQLLWQREEKCKECAKWLKSATEMLSRTSRVFSVQSASSSYQTSQNYDQPSRQQSHSTSDGQIRTPYTTGCAQIYLMSLKVFTEAWKQLLSTGQSIWNSDGALFLSGLRSFIHRLVAVCIPASGNDDQAKLDGQWLLDVLPDILPLLWPTDEVIRKALVEAQKNSLNENSTNSLEVKRNICSQAASHVECVRIVREVVPLINQVILQFKSQASSLISLLLNRLLNSIEASLDAFHFLTVSATGDPELSEEIKLLRRSLGTLLSHVTTHMPYVFQSLGAQKFQEQIYNLLRLLSQSLELSDAMTLKQLLLTLRQMVITWYAEESFRHNFVYSNLSEHLFTMPLSEGFRIEDGQFSLVLNEIAVTWRVLLDKMTDEFLWYLKSSLFPKFHVPDVVAEEFVRHLKGAEEMNFPTYLKKFYSTYKKS